MPNYAFQCKECGEQFEVHESVKEHELHNERCPKCKSGDIEQQYGGIFVKTSKKS